MIWLALAFYQTANGAVAENAVKIAAQTITPTDWQGFLWTVLAALAGALTALSFKQFQPLSRRERFMLVFVGFVFAIFVGPLIVGTILPKERTSSQVVGAFYYLIACAQNWLLPVVLGKFTGVRPPEDRK